MPNWVKVRSDLSPQRDGYVMLDSTNLQAAAATGDADWTYPAVTGTKTVTTGGVTYTCTWSAHATIPVRYRLLSSGMVQLDGAVTHEVTASSGSPTASQKHINTYSSTNLWSGLRFDLFVIPAGYRPDLPYSAGTATWPKWHGAGYYEHWTNSGERPSPTILALGNAYDGWNVKLWAGARDETDPLYLHTLSWWAYQ